MDINVIVHVGGKVTVHIDPKDVFGKDLADTVTANSNDNTIAEGTNLIQNADNSWDVDVTAVAEGNTVIPVTDGNVTSNINVQVLADTVSTIVLTAGAEVAA